MVYLGKEDKILFEKAAKLYNKGKSEFAREIIHSWLFANRLQLDTKRK